MNTAKITALWDVQNQKGFQLLGANPHTWPGALPLDPAGGPAPRPPL